MEYFCADSVTANINAVAYAANFVLVIIKKING